MTWLYYFGLFVLDWRGLSMFMVIFILLLEALDGKRWRGFFENLSWRPRYVIPAIIGLGALYTRILLVDNGVPAEATNPVVQLIMRMIYSHLRSFIFYSAMIMYLWHKWNKLLPALYVGWFGIALIELSFLAQHLIAFGAFMGLEWYLPFIAIMLPFIWERRHFSFQRKTLIFFAAGVFLEYFLLIWQADAFTTFTNGVLHNNAAAIASPTIGTWIHEGLDHLLKSLMTIAFTFTRYEKAERQEILQVA